MRVWLGRIKKNGVLRIPEKAFSSAGPNYALLLRKEIDRSIRATGPISIAELMQMSNMHPKYGYYTRSEIFGKHGDFITAPETTQLFGEMVAVWIAYSLKAELAFTQKRDLELIELGPGNGTLMSDILRTLSVFDSIVWRVKRCTLIEKSPQLTKKQQKLLCPLFPNISFEWKTCVQDLCPSSDCRVFYSNEFFDALPIHLFFKSAANNNWREILVDSIDLGNDIVFKKVQAKTPTPMLKLFSPQEEGGGGWLSEYCPEGQMASKTISDLLSNGSGGGAMLTIDYGKESCRNMERPTLRVRTHPADAIKRHEIMSSPLDHIGDADLSADVDFEMTINRHFCDGNFVKFGPVTQASFLKKMGIERRAASLNSATIDKQMHRLIDPDEMGHAYKVHGLVTLPK